MIACRVIWMNLSGRTLMFQLPHVIICRFPLSFQKYAWLNAFPFMIWLYVERKKEKWAFPAFLLLLPNIGLVEWTQRRRRKNLKFCFIFCSSHIFRWFVFSICLFGRTSMKWNVLFSVCPCAFCWCRYFVFLLLKYFFFLLLLSLYIMYIK